MARKHFIGIGGVGMAALAVLEKALGHDIDGCDGRASKRTRWLESLGIRVSAGHDPSHLDGAAAAVATPAVPADSPEIAAARARGIPVASRGEELAAIVSSRESIAVCGSHGKTTTATFTAKLLLALGENASWAIGGETGDFPVARAAPGFAQGAGPLVVEADESDGTLALYHATILVVTNCEYDHPDRFATKEEYDRCFDTARKNAKLVIEAESLDAGSPAILQELPFLRSLPVHNRKNALAARAVALARGHAPEKIAAALEGIVRELPDRRFETVFREDGKPRIVTDYAHHPTEIGCAIAMAREICRGRLRVVFQPHRYSRTKALSAAFAKAFDGADELILCPVYAAFEKPVEGGSSGDLYAVCRAAQAKAPEPQKESGRTPDAKPVRPRLFLARSTEEAWRHVFLESAGDDAILLLGAGDIVDLVPKAVGEMARWKEPDKSRYVPLSRFSFFKTGGRSAAVAAADAKRTTIVGAGSNMWIPDLTTDREYRKSTGRAALPGATLGIPWMAGIPGTIGGWLKMNAGAFGHSISEAVVRVKAGGRWLSKEECCFGYRRSAIEGEIEDAEFDIPPPEGGADASGYLARRASFPPRCCGSVFKNPPGGFAGRLIESAGAKGLSVGGAYVWSGHANVIAARDGATSSDILALAQIVRDKVRFATGVELEPEIAGLSLR